VGVQSPLGCGTGGISLEHGSGAPEHPFWYHNLKAEPYVEIRDKTEVYAMRVREVVDPAERQRLWDLAVLAFPTYQEYQEKANRLLPVFLAEPAG